MGTLLIVVVLTEELYFCTELTILLELLLVFFSRALTGGFYSLELLDHPLLNCSHL